MALAAIQMSLVGIDVPALQRKLRITAYNSVGREDYLAGLQKDLSEGVHDEVPLLVTRLL